LQAYNQAIDDGAARAASALKPFRHIETIAEAGVRNIAARAASALLASAASALASRNDAFDLGEVTDAGSGSTPLGNAAPFEYVKSATGNDVLSIAARGFGESVQADCFYRYERDMDICNALAGMMGSGMRGLALCKQNAFEDYQTCRGF
jgi:hypothetical protein